MGLRIPWKALSKEKASSTRRSFSPRRIAFLVIAGLALIAGIALRSGHFTWPGKKQNAPIAVTPSSPPVAAKSIAKPTEPVTKPPSPPIAATDTVSQPPSPRPAAATTESLSKPSVPLQEAATPPNEQKEPTGEASSDMILVSRQAVGVLANPSSSAPILYGFPAGRPFRVMGHDGGFAHIQDLKSSASGWIDEAALAPPPSAPMGSAPSQSGSWAGSQQNATADSETSTQPSLKRPGLFGSGGLFGRIFGNRN